MYLPQPLLRLVSSDFGVFFNLPINYRALRYFFFNSCVALLLEKPKCLTPENDNQTNEYHRT